MSAPAETRTRQLINLYSGDRCVMSLEINDNDNVIRPDEHKLADMRSLLVALNMVFDKHTGTLGKSFAARMTLESDGLADGIVDLNDAPLRDFIPYPERLCPSCLTAYNVAVGR